ncbi:MAG: hypothetical protein ACOC9X_06525 [bacterium]
MNHAFNDDLVHYDPPGRSSFRSKAVKSVLLAIELLVVAALFAGALKLWNVRQDLHRELAAAQQMEAALQEAQVQAQPEQSLPPAFRQSKGATLAGKALETLTAPPVGATVAPHRAWRQIQIEAIHEQRARDYQR